MLVRRKPVMPVLPPGAEVRVEQGVFAPSRVADAASPGVQPLQGAWRCSVNARSGSGPVASRKAANVRSGREELPNFVTASTSSSTLGVDVTVASSTQQPAHRTGVVARLERLTHTRLPVRNSTGLTRSRAETTVAHARAQGLPRLSLEGRRGESRRAVEHDPGGAPPGYVQGDPSAVFGTGVVKVPTDGPTAPGDGPRHPAALPSVEVFHVCRSMPSRTSRKGDSGLTRHPRTKKYGPDQVLCGAPPGIRTRNLRIKSPLLCR
jgi:hypothetical protein